MPGLTKLSAQLSLRLPDGSGRTFVYSEFWKPNALRPASRLNFQALPPGRPVGRSSSAGAGVGEGDGTGVCASAPPAGRRPATSSAHPARRQAGRAYERLRRMDDSVSIRAGRFSDVPMLATDPRM